MTASRLSLASHGDLSSPALVFLHAGNVAGWMWEAQLPAFTAYHVLVPNLPGFGGSNHLPWESTVAAAGLIAEIIRLHAVRGRAHVVGLSLGSSVAIELAIRHPDVVDSVFLASPTVAPIPASTRRAALVQLLFWEKRWFWSGLARAYRLPADSIPLFIATGLGIKVETERRILDEVGGGLDPRHLAMLGQSMRTGSERAGSVSAGSVSAGSVRAGSVLAVAGGRDTASVRRDSLAALEAAGVAVALAPGLHHQWNIEDVALFNRSVRDWIVDRAVTAGLVPGSATPPE